MRSALYNFARIQILTHLKKIWANIFWGKLYLIFFWSSSLHLQWWCYGIILNRYSSVLSACWPFCKCNHHDHHFSFVISSHLPKYIISSFFSFSFVRTALLCSFGHLHEMCYAEPTCMFGWLGYVIIVNRITLLYKVSSKMDV